MWHDILIAAGSGVLNGYIAYKMAKKHLTKVLRKKNIEVEW